MSVEPDDSSDTNEEPKEKPKPAARHCTMSVEKEKPPKQELCIGKSPLTPALKPRRYRRAAFDLGTPVVESGMPHQPSPARMHNQMEALFGGEEVCSLPSKKPSLEELVLEGTITVYDRTLVLWGWRFNDLFWLIFILQTQNPKGKAVMVTKKPKPAKNLRRYILWGLWVNHVSQFILDSAFSIL